MITITTDSGETIPLEEKCHACVNGQRPYAGGSKATDCPNCNATGIVANKNGRVIKDFL